MFWLNTFDVSALLSHEFVVYGVQIKEADTGWPSTSGNGLFCCSIVCKRGANLVQL